MSSKITDAEWLEARVRLLATENQELRTALSGLLERYCDLVNSGDCGSWSPEDESQVKAAREALKDEQAGEK